jgi:biotin---protein ligase
VIPTQKLVFVQYLFGLAVVEACRDPGVLGEWGEQVRLKWPNDIYALFGPNKEKKKIGGILMNMSYSGSRTDVVIGAFLNFHYLCDHSQHVNFFFHRIGSGTNILNPLPIPSLTQLIPPGVEHHKLSMERTAAIIMAKFEGLWKTFLEHRGSFEPFMDLYLERWLHS